MAYRSEPSSAVSNDNPPAPHGLEALYRRHRDGLRRYIQLTFGSGPPDPEDVVQVAFESLAQLEDKEAVHNPHGFLVRAARNYVIDQHRRAAVRSRNSDGIRAIGELSDDRDAERVLSAKEQWTVLERAIQSLDDRRRRALIMNRLEGISCARIAEALGVSTTTVKTLVAQALAHCDRALREAGEP